MATVTGPNSAPTGIVQFTVDGGRVGPPIALTGGKATLSVRTLPVGPHTVTAAYGGDALFAASTSPPLAQVVKGTSFKVTSSGDSPTDPGSLRYAITYAAPGATIDLSQVPASAITLTNGPLTIGQDLSLIGPGLYGFLAIDGNNASSVFVITGGNVQMTGLVISHGKSLYGGGINEQGGGLTLTRCLLSQNTSTGGGGGIYDDHSPLALSNCLVSQNTATASFGGGLYNNGGSSVTLTDTTLSGNVSTAGGAVITQQGGSLTAARCTFSGNSTVNSGGAAGGGLYNNGTATLTNSTFTNNSAADVGGLYNHGTMALTNCTISGNHALSGPGGGLGNLGSLTLADTLVAGNAANAGSLDVFCYAGTPLTSRGYNLIGADDAATAHGFVGTDQAGTTARPIDARLGPLQNNGGLTPTMALLPGSPALDKILAGFPLADQRGQLRSGKPDGRADIGAYEAAASLVVTATSDDPADPRSLRSIVNHAAGGDAITFQLPSPATIALDGSNGRLTVSKALVLIGPGADRLAIDGNSATGVFLINGFLNWTIFSGPVSFSGLTIQHGQSQPGDLYGGSGGIFDDHGKLTLVNCTLDHNTSPFGGGIFSLSGNIQMEGCTVSNNGTDIREGQGGGLFNDDAHMALTNCTIAGNASGVGGGGGLGNTFGSMTLNNCTIAGNSTIGMGGGIVDAGLLTLSNTIVAGNKAAQGSPDVSEAGSGAALTSSGYNLIGDSSGAGGFVESDQVGTSGSPINPQMGLLASYGGSTQTMALLPGSPALDKIPASFPAADQRGLRRPQNADGKADIGAYEAQGVATSTALTSNLNPSTNGQSVTFTATVTGPGGTPTGTMQFAVDGGNIGSPVALSSGQAAFNTGGLSVGRHIVTAAYSGNVKLAASMSAPLTQTVNGTTLAVWRGDFETGDLSQWTGVQAIKDPALRRIEVVTLPVIQGKHAARFLVRQGDDPIGSGNDRAELVGPTFHPGEEVFCHWSTLFDPSYPIRPIQHDWQVFCQFHQQGDSGSPPVEFDVRGDQVLFIVNPPKVGANPQGAERVLFTAPLNRGAWHDFQLHVLWHPDPLVGFVELYYNGRLVVPKTYCQTMFDESVYLKLGLYRNKVIDQDGLLWHDGMVVGPTLASVRY